MNNKTPGSDGFTIEFYRFFWNAIGPIMVDSLNCAFENGKMSISQKRGIISLIPKKDKDRKYLKNWRPISLLNNDYKISFTHEKSVTHDYKSKSSRIRKGKIYRCELQNYNRHDVHY